MKKQIILVQTPRIAPVRPSSAPAVLKSICNKNNISSKVIDINLDFFTEFLRQFPKESKIIDDYYIEFNLQLDNNIKEIYTNWINQHIDNILSYDPEMIGICVFSWQSQRFTTDFLKLLRPRFKGKILVGGQGLVFSQNLSAHWTTPTYAIKLLENNLIDYYLKGESEETFARFLNGERDLPGVNNDHTVIVEDMDLVPISDFSDVNIEGYQNNYPTGVLPVESCRGCVRSCAFCEMSTEHGTYRRKDGVKLANELIHYYETTGCRNFYYHDDLINGDLKDFHATLDTLLKYYEDNNLGDRFFTISGYWIIRPRRQFNEIDFEKFYRAGGNTLVTGVETGSDRLRKIMRKGFKNADLTFNLECINKYKLRFYFMLIAGLPGETEEDFNETLKMLTKWQKYVASGAIIGINLGTTATIEPGTDIYNNYQNYNIVGLKGQRPQGINWMCTETPDLTYKERVRRRVTLQEHVIALKYPLWKGDDHLKIIIDQYKNNLEIWES